MYLFIFIFYPEAGSEVACSTCRLVNSSSSDWFSSVCNFWSVRYASSGCLGDLLSSAEGIQILPSCFCCVFVLLGLLSGLHLLEGRRWVRVFPVMLFLPSAGEPSSEEDQADNSTAG